MRLRSALKCTLGGVLLLACNALTGVSDLGVGDEGAPLPDASRFEDDGSGPANDGAPPSDAPANDASSSDVVEEDAPLDPSLIGFWTFDEAVGTTSADKTGKGRDAILQDGASFAPTAGVRGGAVSLGSGMSVIISQLSSPAFPTTGSFSIWFRWRTMEATVQQGIVDTYNDTRTHLFFRHSNQAPSGEMQIAFQPQAAPYVWVDTFTVPQDTWTHVVVTWSESAGRAAAFMNGQLLKDAAYSAPFAPTEQFMRLGNNFDGWLDEMRLYDRALSEVEALAIP